PVDRGAAGVRGQTGHDADDAGRIEPLLALLLGVAHHDVFDLFDVDAGALDHGLDHFHGQIVGANLAKHALVFIGPANRRADGVHNYGAFHRPTPSQFEEEKPAARRSFAYRLVPPLIIV